MAGDFESARVLSDIQQNGMSCSENAVPELAELRHTVRRLIDERVTSFSIPNAVNEISQFQPVAQRLLPAMTQLASRLRDTSKVRNS